MFSFYSRQQETFLSFDNIYNCWGAYVQDQGSDFNINYPFCDYTFGWAQSSPVSYESLHKSYQDTLLHRETYDNIWEYDDATEMLDEIDAVMTEMVILHDRNQKENDNE